MKRDSTIVSVIDRAARAETRVTISTVAGKPVIHARVWYRPRHFKDGQPMIPTRRGLAFMPGKAVPLAKAILKAAGLCLSNTALSDPRSLHHSRAHAFKRCDWCKATFLARVLRGHSPQRFCDSLCRSAWHYAQRCRAKEEALAAAAA